MKVLHVITKLAIGGAQENTISTVIHHNKKGWISEIAVGPLGRGVGNLEKKAENNGIKITRIKGIKNSIYPFQNLMAIVKLSKFIRENRFDIIHTHSSVAGVIGRIAAKLAKTPVIIHTVHGWGLRDDMSSINRWLYITLERFCAKFTNKLIVVSKYNIDKGLKHGIGKREQYEVIHSGIDINKFSCNIDIDKKKKELGFSPDGPIIGMIGRLDVQKNPLDYIRMASRVQKVIPDAQFILVGDGPLRNATEKLNGRLKVNNMHLLGFRDDIEKIIPIFDISVMTSLWEGLPRAFPESMAAKKPIVATNVDGAPEAIIDGRNGFIVPKRRPDLMSEKVIYLLQNPKIATEMGLNGYKNVEKFSLDNMLNDIDRLYERMMGQ